MTAIIIKDFWIECAYVYSILYFDANISQIPTAQKKKCIVKESNYMNVGIHMHNNVSCTVYSRAWSFCQKKEKSCPLFFFYQQSVLPVLLIDSTFVKIDFAKFVCSKGSRDWQIFIQQTSSAILYLIWCIRIICTNSICRILKKKRCAGSLPSDPARIPTKTM